MPTRDIPDKFLVAFSFAGKQRDLVRRIAEAVEARLGPSTVYFDEWYEDYIAGAAADLMLQDIYRGSGLVVVGISESGGDKPWTRAEYTAIRARVKRFTTASSDKDRLGVLPIRVGEGDVPGIFPKTWIVPDVRNKPLDEAVALILARLRWVGVPGPSWPLEPKPYEPRLADRVGELSAIQQLMTATAANRILIFKGPSGFSKTALLTTAARYAIILGVPAAFVDFKDSQLLSQTNVLRKLRLDLGAVLPDFAAAPEPVSWMLLQALRQLSSPALILLDSYEKITQARELVEWIETQLLTAVEQCRQLRFLIAGQKVPERAARWRDLAEEIDLDRIDDKQAWKEWIQQENPQLDDKHVEGVVLGLEGVPGNISAALTAIAKTLPRTA